MLENGFVLLNDTQFDSTQLISALQEDWGISVESEQAQASLTFSVGDTLCSLALMPAPNPDSEAEQRAQGNYYCSDAVDIAASHQAHLMVTVMSQSKDKIDTMKLYSKIIVSCLGQSNATGVYTSGTVFSADFYRNAYQQYLIGDAIPVMLWVFIGLGQNEHGNQLYTVGMEKFGKDEMEILNTTLDMQSMHSSLLSMCSYIITSGLVLQDGETIGFSADQKWVISRSDSVYAPSECSLKISVS